MIKNQSNPCKSLSIQTNTGISTITINLICIYCGYTNKIDNFGFVNFHTNLPKTRVGAKNKISNSKLT
ncbi:hypothetical protein BpHYR1_040913 [Brachionus plicatilis]|uniref:Uncharacterized protein n=1 Tax=Brachionus plicatilis TaxID=10195 RepID=A0A3M7QJS3_BRAPC|nr:hypothetical protein BpHYR1_040913 [Brachionus plicatilis]